MRAQTAVCTAVSPMSGSPTFDTQKTKPECGEFITPPRPTGRRSNNAYVGNTRDDFLYASILCKQSLNCTGTAAFDTILTVVTSLLTIDKHRPR